MTATADTAAEPLRLNLGSRHIQIPGFVDVDRRYGTEVYPLPYPDNSVEEILASHVLEHFSHRQVTEVLLHWIEKLKPGGRLRIAVPDFEKVAKDYLAGLPVNVQGFVMGGHEDDNDKHGAIFDKEELTEAMMACGLERIGQWKGEYGGCDEFDISLNLQGFKPSAPIQKLTNVKAVESMPRFGPVMHSICALKVFKTLQIDANFGQSCFWHQRLSVGMEDAIADPTCKYVLTLDYDTVFSCSDVMELYRLMEACPEADAVCSLQSKRRCEASLFSIRNEQGELAYQIPADWLNRLLLPVNTGHFGLTLIRAESLRNFPRPWMTPIPNKDGLWDKGQTDADIDFWHRFKANGFKLFLAPKVVVGHLEEVVKWPGPDLKPIYQDTGDYEENGIPAEVQR